MRCWKVGLSMPDDRVDVVSTSLTSCVMSNVTSPPLFTLGTMSMITPVG